MRLFTTFQRPSVDVFGYTAQVLVPRNFKFERNFPQYWKLRVWEFFLHWRLWRFHIFWYSIFPCIGDFEFEQKSFPAMETLSHGNKTFPLCFTGDLSLRESKYLYCRDYCCTETLSFSPKFENLFSWKMFLRNLDTNPYTKLATLWTGCWFYKKNYQPLLHLSVFFFKQCDLLFVYGIYFTTLSSSAIQLLPFWNVVFRKKV